MVKDEIVINIVKK